jgi:uncharacterized Rmd1/YagE family protein
VSNNTDSKKPKTKNVEIIPINNFRAEKLKAQNWQTGQLTARAQEKEYLKCLENFVEKFRKVFLVVFGVLVVFNGLFQQKSGVCHHSAFQRKEILDRLVVEESKVRAKPLLVAIEFRKKNTGLFQEQVANSCQQCGEAHIEL